MLVSKKNCLKPSFYCAATEDIVNYTLIQNNKMSRCYHLWQR